MSVMYTASGPGYVQWGDEKKANPALKVPSVPVAGPFVTVRGPADSSAYPETRHSLFTMVRDVINRPVEGGAKPNFWERTAFVGLVLLFINYLVAFATNLAYVVVQEKATTFGIEYSVVAGLSVAAQLYLTTAFIHRKDGVLQLAELWMNHMSINMPVVWQRLVHWLACMVMALAAEYLAALSVHSIQVNNAVTLSGLPTVVGNEWRAFGILIVCYVMIYWVMLHAYYNPEAASDANNSNAPIMVGLTVAIATYISTPYTGGGLSFERYIGSSIAADFWPTNGWVYAAAPAAATLFVYVAFYWVGRTTKDGSVKND